MTEAESVAMLVKAGMSPTVVTTDDGHKFLVSPPGYVVKDFTDPNSLPLYHPQTARTLARIETEASLTDYVKKFSTEDSVLFADMAGDIIQAVIDYHSKDEAALLAHRATLTLPHSEEWSVWARNDSMYVKHLDFARFLEDNGRDIISPSYADLLESIRDLQAARKMSFNSAVRTGTDNVNVMFSDETDANSRGVEIPAKFTISIPVYLNDPPSSIDILLRWKLEEGKGMTLSYKRHRALQVKQASFRAIMDRIKNDTGRPVLYGSVD